MPSRNAQYRAALEGAPDWRRYVLDYSNLPGPRANLELLYAAAEWVDPDQALELASLSPDDAPGNAPPMLLAGIGVVALARLAVEGKREPWGIWRALAADPRWRVRETVAMALQQVGDADWDMLVRETNAWLSDGPWQWRAIAAGLCEPRLLVEQPHAAQALTILDDITRRLAELAIRHSEGVRVLRQGLGYAWSVAIVACPAIGKSMLERWAESDDRDIVRVVRENLGKARLSRMDAAWVASLASRMGKATSS